VMIPAGFGLIFHGIIVDSMAEGGITLTVKDTALSMLIPGLGMVIGLLVAVFITYRKDRVVKNDDEQTSELQNNNREEVRATFNIQHVFTIVAILFALIVQIMTEDLIAGALTGLVCMFVFVAVPFKQGDQIMSEGISMMGTI